MGGPEKVLKAFLSHTSEMAEYPQPRSFVQAAKDGVIEAKCLVDDMQFFPGSDQSPRELDTERLLQCDVYVGILGFKYGSPVRDQPEVSYTQHEFREARRAGKRLLVFLLDEQAEGLPPAATRDVTYGGRQDAFRQEVQDLGGAGLVCQKFKNADELQRLLVRALRHLQSPIEQGDTPAASTIDLFEAVLATSCARHVSQWHACLKGDEDQHDRLDHYVEPHYSLLNTEAQIVATSDRLGRAKPVGAEVMGGGHNYEPVAADGDDAETELAKLLSASSRLCLAEDAGAGKSVFTRRALAFASSQRGREALFAGKACLAVRWEQWENDWPTDFERALADAIAEDCHSLAATLSPDDLVAWALRERRVLLILDGLDQVDDEDVIQGLARFLNGAARNCRAIVTGRSYKVEQYRRNLFRNAVWRFAKIEGFDDDQIAEYMTGYDVDTLFPERAAVADLLKIPSVLRIVRELLEQGDLQSFSTRGELYLQASFHLILRAGKLVDSTFDERQTRRVEQILAAVAFEMMTRQMYGYAARGVDLVDTVERGASRRCANGISDREWTLIRGVTNFTNHCILEGNSQAMLSWQHRAMMEFYCGLHLARHATDECLRTAKSFANAGDWHWAWRFAIEMPENVAEAQIRTAALAILFQRPESGRRPNELIYRAWNAMELTGSGQQELARFQREFRSLVEQGQPLAVKLEQSFRPCPPGPNHDRLTFLMGSPDTDEEASNNEKPQVEMTVTPFLMSNAPTTKAQYWLYDAAHQDDPEIAALLRKYSPTNDCPVIYVTWYDAWCFAKWCQAGLPSEVEWEFACRAGSTTRYWWGNDFDESTCNMDGKQTTAASESHANPWGLMEMSGNVWEWCDTWYHDQIKEGNKRQFVGESRVLRGGSFSIYPLYLRSAIRGWSAPDGRDDVIGFRVSRTP